MRLTTRMALLVGAIALVRFTASAQQTVPIRELIVVDAASSKHFGNIFGVRQLAGGGVLVNDGIRRQLVVLDGKLANPMVIIDSIVEGGQSYGNRASPIIPYFGDSTLFVDGESLTLVVIDPAGKLVRVIAPPNPKDIRNLARGTSGIDARGNLVYRGEFTPKRERRPGDESLHSAWPDTAPILRANFETRAIDTVGAVKYQPPLSVDESKDANGKLVMKITMNPLLMIDEWAVLSNGSVAMVRGHDYHVDFIQPDGQRVSGAKLPFDFRRLTDDDKQKLIDSARTAEQKRRDSVSAATPRTAAGGGSNTEIAVRPLQAIAPPLIEFVPFSEIPDYYPPIRQGAAKPDADGNLWILPTTSAQSKNGELIYDVVNSRGAMTERVRIPAGRSIAGFGRSGVVYLMSRDSSGWLLERTSLPKVAR